MHRLTLKLRNAILNIRKNFPEVKESICFDMLEGFPFANSSTDLVIADLCLHYFSKNDTIKILKDIKRILSAECGHACKRTIVMPYLYQSRQDKRDSRAIYIPCALKFSKII